jgi:hypothetical protein
MTAHISRPFVHVEDSNGEPYVSAKLYVYDVNTTNLKSIYSDTGLSVSISNPMTSDASGNFARAYVASGTYKLRAETSGGSLIWQHDYIDTGLTSGSGALAISAGGTSATTAAGARTALGAAAQTDVDDLADDVSTISDALQNLVANPQGRLCMTTLTPVPVADVSAGTAVYYTPFTGSQVPIWDGTKFALQQFAELTLTMNANHLANQLYDIFVWLEGSTVTIGTGPAWNTATAGAGARGTGAGTTELERKNGVFTNKVAMTTRNGATTYSVGVNLATYLGTIVMDGSNGQISEHVTAGQSRAPGPWNAYNRIERELIARDSTSSWNYSSATVRASNGDANNKVMTLCGLPVENIFCRFTQRMGNAVLGSNSGEMAIHIGLNDTTVEATGATQSYFQASITSAITIAIQLTSSAEHTILPTIGINNIQALESVPSNIGTEAFFGGTDMRLSVRWRV